MQKLFVKSGCSFCRITLLPASLHNLKVSLKDRVDIVDCYEWEHFRMKTNPLLDKLPVDAYPTLIHKGIKATNILSKNQFKAFLDGLTINEKKIPEENRWMGKFNKLLKGGA